MIPWQSFLSREGNILSHKDKSTPASQNTEIIKATVVQILMGTKGAGKQGMVHEI